MPFARDIGLRACWLALLLTTALLGAAHAGEATPGPETFFHNQRMTGAEISPDGQTVVLTLAGHDSGRIRLMALDLKTMKFTLLAGYDDVDIRSFHWVNDHRVVFDLIDLQAPVEDRNKYAWGLYAVNTDGSMLRQLVDRQWSPWIERGGERPLLPWYTYFLRPVGDATTNDIWVYKMEEFDKTHVDYLQLEKVDTMRGRAIDIDTPPHTTGWVFDAKGELRVATVENDNHLKVMARDVDAGTWSVLGDFDRFFDDKAFAPGYIDENGTLYVSAYNGNDKAAVWTYDLAQRKMADKPFLVSQRYDLDPGYLVAQRQARRPALRRSTPRSRSGSIPDSRRCRRRSTSCCRRRSTGSRCRRSGDAQLRGRHTPIPTTCRASIYLYDAQRRQARPAGQRAPRQWTRTHDAAWSRCTTRRATACRSRPG